MATSEWARLRLESLELPEQIQAWAASTAGADSLDLHGNADLLSINGVGLSGSRSASDRGVELASVAGAVSADLNVPLVSGYASGVDTAGHVAALSAGGSTIAVLAEGIERFRLREEYRGFDIELEQLTVASQFESAAGWSVRRAMARNALICALSAVLVVIEPGESGGTIAAAREALRTSRDGRKQPQPLILVLRPDHQDDLHPEIAKLRRREHVTCVETAEALESAIRQALLAGADAQAAQRLL